jgi:hypothetical protein
VTGPEVGTQASPRAPKLYAALAKAQATIRGAAKDTENPFFRSRYADLASVWTACREALAANELCVLQLPETRFEGTPEIYTFKSKAGEDRGGVRVVTVVSVRTILGHSSGEAIEGVVSAIIPGGDPQPVGSAITYLRRYGLAAIVGVAPEDDDGEATARPVPRGVNRETGEIGEPAKVAEAVTLDTVVPFGKHKGKMVREVGNGYFDYLSGQADFDEAKGKAWHTFTLAALKAFEDAEAAVPPEESDGETEGIPPEFAGGKQEPEAVQEPPSESPEEARRALVELLQRPEVPERTRNTYLPMLTSLGEKATPVDIARIMGSVLRAVKASA